MVGVVFSAILTAITLLIVGFYRHKPLVMFLVLIELHYVVEKIDILV